MGNLACEAGHAAHDGSDPLRRRPCQLHLHPHERKQPIAAKGQCNNADKAAHCIFIDDRREQPRQEDTYRRAGQGQKKRAPIIAAAEGPDTHDILDHKDGQQHPSPSHWVHNQSEQRHGRRAKSGKAALGQPD